MVTSPAKKAVASRIDRLRQLCLALPETSERLSHGEPTFFIREKKSFVMSVDDHHGDGVLGFWAAAPIGAQAELIDAAPERYFRPPYVGHRGWIGVRLDVPTTDWNEVAEIVTEAYCLIAPKSLAALVRPS